MWPNHQFNTNFSRAIQSWLIYCSKDIHNVMLWLLSFISYFMFFWVLLVISLAHIGIRYLPHHFRCIFFISNFLVDIFCSFSFHLFHFIVFVPSFRLHHRFNFIVSISSFPVKIRVIASKYNAGELYDVWMRDAFPQSDCDQKFHELLIKFKKKTYEAISTWSQTGKITNDNIHNFTVFCCCCFFYLTDISVATSIEKVTCASLYLLLSRLQRANKRMPMK